MHGLFYPLHGLRSKEKCLNLKKKIESINDKLNKGLPSIPSTIKDELECNIFLRSENKSIQKNLNLNNINSLQTFSKLRDLKDNF